LALLASLGFAAPPCAAAAAAAAVPAPGTQAKGRPAKHAKKATAPVTSGGAISCEWMGGPIVATGGGGAGRRGHRITAPGCFPRPSRRRPWSPSLAHRLVSLLLSWRPSMRPLAEFSAGKPAGRRARLGACLARQLCGLRGKGGEGRATRQCLKARVRYQLEMSLLTFCLLSETSKGHPGSPPC
jgi:hypothetical protein